MRSHTILTAMLVAGFVFSQITDSAVAQSIGTVWDASADYSTSANPNPNNFGAWSYGRTPYVAQTPDLPAFTLYDENAVVVDAALNIQAWQDSGPGSVDILGAVSYNANVDRRAAFGITWDPMEIGLVPDQTGANVSTVKFTAPVAGQFEVHAEFMDNQGGAGPVPGVRAADAWVLSDPDGTLFHVDPVIQLTLAGQDAREEVHIYDGTVNLLAGESLYFASGKGFVGGGDHVELRATVTMVPEPSSVALLLLGALSLGAGAIRRRRRRS